MNADSIIKLIDGGGVLTMGELKRYLYDIEADAKRRGMDFCQKNMEIMSKKIRLAKEKRKSEELNDILTDVYDYLYKMRRLRNGQDLEPAPVKRERIGDRRFMGKEKIKA